MCDPRPRSGSTVLARLRAGEDRAGLVVALALLGRVVVDWRGLTPRARTSGYRPRVDERVTVSVRRGLAFPSEGVRSARRVPA